MPNSQIIILMHAIIFVQENEICDTPGIVVGAIAIISIAVSIIAFCIVMAVGWPYTESVLPENDSVKAAAILATVPLFAIVGGILMCGSLFSPEIKCTIYVGACIVFFGAAIELAAGILFVVNLGDDSRAMAFGVSAGVFAMIAALGCCIAACSCACLRKVFAESEDY